MRSRQVGLARSISKAFFSRCQHLCCFSRARALRTREDGMAGRERADATLNGGGVTFKSRSQPLPP